MCSPFWSLLGQRKSWLALAILALAIPGETALAQLVPDATLGTQSSTISTSGSVDTVNGGVRAGSNLFHSFRELNVEMGRSLYFTDPGVTNILTRVTGSHPSLINGRLGVNGLANLFLINPNGIIFGANASLDVRGSFTATTASAIKFADGSEFSATHPTSSNLLTISVPIGLQRGANQSPATIINRGNLQVGRDLTLDANQLDLQGQLQAGRNLTLVATDTVTVRDTINEPFRATSGGDLTVRGGRGIDILALNHLQQPAFRSGGNLTLLSDGVISGDARFESGGSFQVQPIAQELATFTSLFDPIITSAGDVNLALNYSGPSLLIEAGGNIRIQGTVNITTPDVAAPFVGDDNVLNSQAGLILRSGQTTRRYSSNSGAVAGSSTGVGLVPAAGITLNRNVTVAPGGVVRLTADGIGSIRTQRITAHSGEITMTSGRSITTSGQPLDVATDTGNAGSIRLTALNGNLSTGDLLANSESYVGGVGNGGTIALTSTNGNLLTGNIRVGSFSYTNSGNGGTVNLLSNNGSITVGDVDGQVYAPSLVGNGTTVTATSSNGNLFTGNINLSLLSNFNTVSRQAGAISFTTNDGNITTGDLGVQSQAMSEAGVGGTVRIFTGRGNIALGNVQADSGGLGSARTGGTITVETQNGNLITQNLSVQSYGSEDNGLGNGGAITLLSPSGSITTGNIEASSVSRYFATGDAGVVSLAAANGLTTGNISNYALSQALAVVIVAGADPTFLFVKTGRGGTTTLTSTGGSIATGDVLTFSTTAQDPSIFFGTPEDFEYGRVVLRSQGHGAGGDVRFTAGQNITTGLISTVSSDGSGAIALSAGNTFTANGTPLSSDTFGAGTAGNIQISADSVQLQSGAQLSASSHATGAGGTIAIAANKLTVGGTATPPPTTDLNVQTPFGLTVLPNVYLGGYLPTGDATNLAPGGAFPSGIFAQTTRGSTGSAGNITIQAGQLNLHDQGAIGTTTFGSGNAGNVTIQAKSVLANNSSIFSGVAPGATGNSGTIALSAESLDLINRGRIQSLTLGAGRAGDIQIQTNATTIAGDFSGIISGSGTPDQRGGAIGDGGDVRITTDTLRIKDAGIVSASTFTQGRSGNIAVSANTVELISQGKLSATTQNQGNAGSITVNARDRVLISGALSGIFVSATPQAIGNGGSVVLTAEQLVLQDRGRITSGSDGKGQSGDIHIAANQIDLNTQARILAETGGSGQGGNISLTTNQLTVQGEASVSVSTQASGNAGNMTVTARDRTQISGNNSGLFASTSPQASGNSGSISLITANLDVGNGGRISASSQGSGRGGDVAVTANQITLKQQGKIIAETTSSDGGNIHLTVRDILLMRDNSLISASAGTAQAGGNGGNVTINAGFVVGVLRENSDIRANAFTGNGGRVDITAQGIYGLKFQPKDTPFSDITASSQFGVSGTVTLNTLNVDPNRGLIQLPINFSDPTNQIAQTCSPQQQRNSFVITGRGGVSPGPTEALNQTEIWQEQTEGRRQEPEGTIQNSKFKIQNSIVEATTWRRNPDGSISLVAEGETVLPAIAPSPCKPQMHSEAR